MGSDDHYAQREALERLQREMREHAEDAAALADRIAELQARIDKALEKLAKVPDTAIESAAEQLDL
jgi:hypothetical protein